MREKNSPALHEASESWKSRVIEIKELDIKLDEHEIVGLLSSGQWIIFESYYKEERLMLVAARLK